MGLEREFSPADYYFDLFLNSSRRYIFIGGLYSEDWRLWIGHRKIKMVWFGTAHAANRVDPVDGSRGSLDSAVLLYFTNKSSFQLRHGGIRYHLDHITGLQLVFLLGYKIQKILNL